MYRINSEQQELIFDYCMGLACPSDSVQAEALIAENPHAAELHATIDAAIAPLGYLPLECCPDDLANRTLRLLSAQINGPDRLAGPRVIKLGFLSHFSNAAGVIMTAASILLIVGVLARSFTVVRQHYAQQSCADGMSRIHQAVSMYSADYDGFLPAVARAEGAAWYPIGQRGPQSCSNTRNPFLLLKYGYSEQPSDFLCGGRTGHNAPPLTMAQVAQRDDFPSRDQITYSYRLMPSTRVKMTALGDGPLMADMNPHFERSAIEANAPYAWQPDDVALHLNSPNHGGQGQNVLGADGHVQFSRTRLIGSSEDDIYTMDNGSMGDGCKTLPSRLDDVMLAP